MNQRNHLSTQDRPNFLWISNHDSSAWNYGCYGDQYAHTPNIDRLAAEGVRYTNAFTAGPICSPSRTSIYTGMHPTTLGTHHHRSAVIRPEEVELLNTMLTNAGYACTEPDNDINLYISKYIRWLVPGEIEEMYDLENDPEELENLALESDYHELLAQFRQGTIDELRRTDAGMVDNLPPVKVMTREQLLGGADR